MNVLRAIYRLLLLLILTAGFCCMFFGGQTLLPLLPGNAYRWRNWNFRSWARIAMRLLHINVDVTNRPPCTPSLLVTNHLSYIDVLVLASQMDCAFIAKSEVAGWPVIGWLGRRMNTVFIKRNQYRDILRTMRQTQELIDSGLGVVLFAEGTSTAGKAVAPFKSSMLDFAARNHIPVHYASLSYATASDESSADQSVCWWGDMTFTDHFFRLLQLSNVEAKLTFGLKPIVARDRRVLAAKLWQAVNAQFTPVPVH